MHRRHVLVAEAEAFWRERFFGDDALAHDVALDGAVDFARACYDAGAILAVDSTAATPVHTRPLEHGADVVVHSATKYLNGHGDVIAGAVVLPDRGARWSALVAHRRGAGAVLGPFEAYLLLRGMRTLFVRVRRQSETALAIARALERHPGWQDLPLAIHHASEVITMEDSPAKAVRSRPDASMPVAFDLVRQGKADAVMSAGNSGAMLACGLFKFRRIKGVDRPALVTSLPTRATDGWVALLDVGANVDCKPLNLVQFAIMGAVYAGWKHGKARPRVGLLSNGTEEGKGTDLTRAVHRLLSDHPLHGLEYAGYVEGNHLFAGEVDVVVTDGFSGNVALKVAEATGRLIAHWLRGSLRGGARRSLGALLLKPAFDELKASLLKEGQRKGVKKGLAPLVHQFERKLGRALSTAEHTTLRKRLRTHGPARLGDVVLDLDAVALARWIEDPAAQ